MKWFCLKSVSYGQLKLFLARPLIFFKSANLKRMAWSFNYLLCDDYFFKTGGKAGSRNNFTGQSNINQILILMFVFCGLITEAYYVHCFRRSWLAWLCPWGTRSPAGSWTCTTWWLYRVTVPAWPSYSSRTSSTKVASLIGSTFQKSNFEW